MALTPMMRQYLDIKEQYKGYILLFRLGDFYEMFYDDARLVSRELELTLTGKDCGEEERAPMCGVPYHSAESYIGRLVAKGYKIAICEQTENPADAKGLVRREVTRVITPGTIIENNFLDESKNNYLCAVCFAENEIGLCFADASTGDVFATLLSGEGQNIFQKLQNELATYSPREILVNTDKNEPACQALSNFAVEKFHCIINDGLADIFDFKQAVSAIRQRYGETERRENHTVIRAIGALLRYITETQKSDTSYVKELRIYGEGQYLEMDMSTRRNLELCESMRTKEKKGTLLWVLDKTKTSMGARLLRKWVEQPLLDVKTILRRQGAVSALVDSFMLREELAQLLRGVLDLERLMTKMVYGTANGRDMRAIGNTIKVLPEIKQLLFECADGELTAVYRKIDDLLDVDRLLSEAIVEDPPFSVREGGMIRAGYDKNVDELNDIIHNGKGYIEKIEAAEREKTGIKGLKIGYNRVFGYYIEITKSFLGQVPPEYIRKQTLSNCERFITEELKNLEATILGASDKIAALEYEIFCRVRDFIASQAERIQSTAEALAALDVYISLADVAVKNSYVCPELDYGDVIKIKDGRHPVVEQFVSEGTFVPNDTNLDTGHNRLMLITGPNMAGKSTYMRQVALICVMAQTGSFIPAREARIGVVDKVFTRVGASDDLASGQSTFMLEMTEVAYILKNATRRSLIVYDEIGRGTSTFDGMSIARATAEYTAGKKLGAKTLFATHYHELTELEQSLPGVVNYNIAAKKRGEDIIFLRKILKGAADDSYGIEVAKLAGVPGEIIKRAKEVLRQLEKKSAAITAAEPKEEEVSEKNITLEDIKKGELIEKLNNMNLELLTPIEALNSLYELKKMAKL